MPTENTTRAGARTHLELNRISNYEMNLIEQIAERAFPLYGALGIADNKLTIMMDLAGAHIDCPIALDELRDANEETFHHDVFGIRRHFNRRTFRLEDCFLPRTAL